MKTRIIVILICATSYSMVHAQINRPKINTKTGELIHPPRSNNGIKFDFNKIKSVGDLKKINLPYIEISPEKLNAKPQRSWRVGPSKIVDGNLAIKMFRGTYYDHTFRFSDEFVNLPVDGGRTIRATGILLPLELSFRAMAGAEYRLKLKHIGPYVPQGKIIVQINDEAQNVTMNRSSEFNIVFIEETTKNITISFTGLLKETSESYFTPIIFSSVLVDKIN